MPRRRERSAAWHRGYDKEMEAHDEMLGRQTAGKRHQTETQRLRDTNKEYLRKCARVETYDVQIRALRYALRSGTSTTGVSADTVLKKALEKTPYAPRHLRPKNTKTGKKKWKPEFNLLEGIFGTGDRLKKTKDKNGKLTSFGNKLQEKLDKLLEKREEAIRERDEYLDTHQEDIELYREEYPEHRTE